MAGTARGDKDKYTDKQKRQAEHIEEGYEKRGTVKEEADTAGEENDEGREPSFRTAGRPSCLQKLRAS